MTRNILRFRISVQLTLIEKSAQPGSGLGTRLRILMHYYGARDTDICRKLC